MAQPWGGALYIMAKDGVLRDCFANDPILAAGVQRDVAGQG